MHGVPPAPLLWLQLALLGAAGAGARVSAPRSLAWGPGLQATAVLPVRYFFLQAVDSDGRNLTSSPPGQCRSRSRPLASLSSDTATSALWVSPSLPSQMLPSLLPETHEGGRRHLGPWG